MKSELMGITGNFASSEKVELCCQDCKAVVRDVSLANDRICPKCGGQLVGIRFSRNPLTRKVIVAERVEL